MASPSLRASWWLVALVGCGGNPTPVPPAPKPPPVPTVPPPVVSELPPDHTIPAAYQPSMRTLVAGVDFTCGLRGGVAHCWGGNARGQLGDGGRGYRFGPVPVAVNDIVSLAAGGASACARVRDGGVWCWGAMGGADGAPRDLGREAQHVAVSGDEACLVLDGDVTCVSAVGDDVEENRVAGIDDAAAVAVRDGGGCARTATGVVACWSDGGDEAYLAEPVEGLAEVVRLAARGYETCALRASPDEAQRTVLCWGSSSKLKAPLLEPRVVTRDLHLGDGWGCLEGRDGLSCWGARPDGEEYRRDEQSPSFELIVGAVTFAAGDEHLCGQLANGDTLCLGNNDEEQLGVPSGLIQPHPQLIPEVAGATGLVSGTGHACVMGAETICWGREDARLGEYGASSPHVLDPPLNKPSAMAAGEHTCAIASGQLTCWGDGSWGQLGDEGGAPPKKTSANAGLVGLLGTRLAGDRVHQVKGIGPVTSVAVGQDSTCVVAGGKVSCWGRLNMSKDEHSTPCDGSPLRSSMSSILGGTRPPKPGRTAAEWCEELKKPHVISGTRGATKVVSVGGGFCALVGPSVRCWNQAQLVAGLPPRVVPRLKQPTALFGGRGEACARHADGLGCWSYATMFPRPPEGLKDVLGGGEVAHVATGTDHTCAVDMQGRVICWGRNGAGQLGRSEGVEPPEEDEPEYANRKSRDTGAQLGAAVVMGLPKAKAVALGHRHSCALSRGGQVHCWGGPGIMLGGGRVITVSLQPLRVEGWP